MQRLLRSLWTAIAAMSLVLLVACVYAAIAWRNQGWAWRRVHVEPFPFPPTVSTWDICAAGGNATIRVKAERDLTYRTGDPDAIALRSNQETTSHLFSISPRFAAKPQWNMSAPRQPFKHEVHVDFAGVAWFSVVPPLLPAARPTITRILIVPLWLIALASAFAPAIWTARYVRCRQRQRRARSGLCTFCGYDLRASTGRCPECGNAIDRPPALQENPPAADVAEESPTCGRSIT